ncbi:MAG: hypothetical protein RJA70_4609, partial [Pseudomonadota bacterium]|jgi:type III secretion protein V
MQKDMEVGFALKRYGLLTIGDGLVSQIPALLLSTAAGILVTRVASEEKDTALGRELGSQLFRAPKALTVAAFFVVALGLVPGMPTLPLVVIGLALLGISRLPQKASESEVPGMASEPVQNEPRTKAQRFVPVVIPWALEFSPDLETLMEDETRGGRLLRPGLRSVGNAARELLFRELGVPMPACLSQSNAELPDRHAVLSLYEVPTQVLRFPEGLRDAEVAQYVMDQILPTLRARASDYLGISETQVLLDKLEQVSPATVRQVTPKPVSLPLLADVLRRLVEEGVSIRDLKGILESLAQVATADKDPLNLTEYVRSQLRRHLTYEVTGGAPELRVMLLTPDVEETIRGAISRTSVGSFLTLAPAAGRDIVRATRRALEGAITEHGGAAPVLLTQSDIRRFVRKLLENDLSELKVMSFSELLPEINLKQVGTVGRG